MAEFDSGGLSAVSAFFGLGDKKERVDEPTHDASHDISRRGRQGVGSVTKQVTLSATSDSTIGRVLNVGKRKRQRDDDDDDCSGSHEIDVEDNEDEEGRTSIAATVKPKVSTNDNTSVQVQKKKKGKKERQAKALEKTVQQEQDAAEMRQGEHETMTKEEQTKQRKRRKIRSRQKNIYKDKRLAQHKPSHLILGRTEFAGRPLTAETRVKLNLAPSRSSRAAQEHEDDTERLETPIHDSYSHGEGVKLAIDDLLDEGEVQGDANGNLVVEQKPPVKNKMKKKKKSKYKNLQS